MRTGEFAAANFWFKVSEVFKKCSRTVLFLLLLCLTGCSMFSLSRRPDNRIVPAVSFDTRMRQWNQGHDSRDVQWLKIFHSRLQTMDGWAPPTNWFTADTNAVAMAMRRVIDDERLPAYRLPTNVPAADLRQASDYFFLSSGKEDRSGMRDFLHTNFFAPPLPTENLPLTGKNNLLRQAANMLLRMDEEHKTLLASSPPSFDDRGQHGSARRHKWSARSIRWESP